MTDLDLETADRPFNAGPLTLLKDVPAFADLDPVTVHGALTDVTVRTTRQGRQWATAWLHDATGTQELLIFPDVYETFEHLVREGARLVVCAWVNALDLNRHGHRFPPPPALAAQRLFTLEGSR